MAHTAGKRLASSVALGTRFELSVISLLAAHGVVRLARLGGSGDRGVDFVGEWLLTPEGVRAGWLAGGGGAGGDTAHSTRGATVRLLYAGQPSSRTSTWPAERLKLPGGGIAATTAAAGAGAGAGAGGTPPPRCPPAIASATAAAPPPLLLPVVGQCKHTATPLGTATMRDFQLALGTASPPHALGILACSSGFAWRELAAQPRLLARHTLLLHVEMTEVPAASSKDGEEGAPRGWLRAAALLPARHGPAASVAPPPILVQGVR